MRFLRRILLESATELDWLRTQPATCFTQETLVERSCSANVQHATKQASHKYV